MAFDLWKCLTLRSVVFRYWHVRLAGRPAQADSALGELGVRVEPGECNDRLGVRLQRGGAGHVSDVLVAVYMLTVARTQTSYLVGL